MLIGKSNGCDAFRRYVDAQSRLSVWIANHVKSPLISKLGLTHIPGGGAVDASGTKMLYASGPGLVLEKDVAEPGIVPVGGFLLPPQAPVVRHRELVDIAPGCIPLAFREVIGGDPIYKAEKLGLFSRDMDKVSGPKLGRYFCESEAVADGFFNFPCYNEDGSFKARYVLFGSSVCEVKNFKYTDCPQRCFFLFKPKVSAVFAPPNCDGTFTTNANIAVNNLGMGWIGTAGGVEQIDWGIIRRFGKDARLLCPVFSDDQLQTYSCFKETFFIATEAKRRGIAMKIVQAKATVETRYGGMWEAQESVLDDRKAKKMARKYGLKIDPVWNGLPGEIDFDEEPLARRKVSPFWDGNRFAVFFGKISGDFMVEILARQHKSRLFRGRVLVIVDEKDLALAARVHAVGGSRVRVATFEVCKDKDVFAEDVPSETDLVFMVPPSGGNEMKIISPAILNICAQLGLPVGIFSRSEDAPQQEADTVHYYVAKHPSADGAFCVKNMNINTITKYTFSPSGVEVAPGAENDMREG